jgi:hypothetical protein
MSDYARMFDEHGFEFWQVASRGKALQSFVLQKRV